MFSIIHFYILITALISTTIIVPFVTRLSLRFGGLDHPGGRKMHSQATPRLGGIAIFSSLLFTCIYFVEIDSKIKGFLAGAIVVFLTGLADDLGNLTPRKKFIGEFIAAGLAVFLGDICVLNLGNPFGLGIIELGMFAQLFTIIGIVGLINAINLLDGLDGLAGGVCTLACISFAIITFSSANYALFTLTIVLLGSLIGFLRYNNYPAKIFMGDCGSLLLGYCMGVFSVLLATGGKTVSPYIPLLILGVPILDTLVVMINRKRAGRKLFTADQTHLHHRLLDLGINHKFTVQLVFGMSYLLSLIAIFGRDLSDSTLLLTLLVLAIASYGILYWLTHKSWANKEPFFRKLPARSDSPRHTIIKFTRYLVIFIKYLIITALLLPVFLTSNDLSSFSVVLFILLLVSIIMYLSKCSWSGMLLPGYIYGFGFLLIFALEYYGQDENFLGVTLPMVSNALFLILFVGVLVLVILRKLTSRVIVSNFEYLVMLIVLSMPLLPSEFSDHYHLLAVAIKSLTLFVGFKLVLMRRAIRNRKIMLAIVVSMLVLILRNIMS